MKAPAMEFVGGAGGLVPTNKISLRDVAPREVLHDDEFARPVRQHAHPLIAITAAEHAARVTPRHPSGRRLAEIADVVLDNGAPYGDALLPPPGGGTVGAISSITSALLGRLVAVEVARQLQDAGQVPPIYLSANVPGGDEHNTTLESRYAGRIRRTA